MVVLAVIVSLFVVEVPYLTMELLTETTTRYNNTTAHCEMYTPQQVGSSLFLAVLCSTISHFPTADS